MNYVVGSGTSYNSKPPNFSVMYLDPDTMLPIDYNAYSMDLDYSNKHDTPKWEFNYNMLDFYNLTDMSPASFYEVSKSIYYDCSSAMKYRNHRNLNSPPAEECDMQ